ncbi:putative GTP-binding protein 6 [Varroa jacobsoni]|uniref:putative GTP-binding protein 6 n=1 Tax=Varroa jacobsoni TaxID=62625 RepID=UPI000BF2BB6C|nr:putative GTP-binding protein 6 [Varroa jacobsoni]
MSKYNTSIGCVALSYNLPSYQLKDTKMRAHLLRRYARQVSTASPVRRLCTAPMITPGKVDDGINDEPYIKLTELGVFNSPTLESHTSLIVPSLLRKNVVLIHPILKRIPKAALNTTTQLQVAEAKALVATIGNHWNLCETIALNTQAEQKRVLFGTGNFSIIRDVINERQRRSPSVVAFFNVTMLTAVQQHTLRQELGVDVYDRYMLVLLIFKQHARTKEAKLQTSLAELSYYRQRMKLHGSTDMLVQLEQREGHVKRELEYIQGHRSLLRKKRQKLQLPVVAVVGYTNAGKTSLIKKFTDSNKLVPLNQLFATLDVTCHEGYLPKLSKIIYIDTVGFISDIPTQLIASFRATLEDALLADQLVHVFDISHPDLERQCETVLKTLQSIETSAKLMDTIIHVGNKVDLIDDADLMMSRAERVLGRSAVSASSVTGQGISDVLANVEDSIIGNTGRKTVKIRCAIGTEVYSHILRSSNSVKSMSVDEANMNYTTLEVVITSAALSKLQAKYCSNEDVTFP